MILMSFCSKFIRVYMRQYFFTVKRFNKVIAEIKWCSFLPHSVETPKHWRETDSDISLAFIIIRIEFPIKVIGIVLYFYRWLWCTLVGQEKKERCQKAMQNAKVDSSMLNSSNTTQSINQSINYFIVIRHDRTHTYTRKIQWSVSELKTIAVPRTSTQEKYSIETMARPSRNSYTMVTRYEVNFISRSIDRNRRYHSTCKNTCR